MGSRFLFGVLLIAPAWAAPAWAADVAVTNYSWLQIPDGIVAGVGSGNESLRPSEGTTQGGGR